MPFAAIIVTTLGFAIVLLTLLSQAALWQRKEYRWDRILDFLRSPESKSRAVWLLAAVLLLMIIAWPLYQRGAAAAANTIGWMQLLLLTAYHAYRIVRRGVFRPRFTLRAALILIGATVLTLIHGLRTLPLLTEPLGAPALQWSTLVIAAVLYTAIAVGVVTIPAALRKRMILAQAAAHRQRHSATVIGITGSYGKTSTKHFLYHLLRQHSDQTIATKEHRNAAYPVALDILEQLTDQTKYYVVEMAAYTRGEIGTLARLARPQVGVVTAISNQHLSLFGSLEKLAQAKWELIDALPPDGIAVLNADDPTVRKQASHFTGRITWYSRHQPADVYATNISYKPRSTTFTLHLQSYQKNIDVPLAGEGYLSSILAAAAVTLTLNVPPEAIVHALTTLTPLPHTMEIKSGKNQAIIIDDSYSANEAGVLAALKHLKRFPQQRKIAVLLPLLELGSQATAVHERIGQALADSATHAIIAGSAYRDAIERGFANVKPATQLEVIPDPKELAGRLASLASPDSVILLEGRLPDIARHAVLASSEQKEYN